MILNNITDNISSININEENTYIKVTLFNDNLHFLFNDKEVFLNEEDKIKIKEILLNFSKN